MTQPIDTSPARLRELASEAVLHAGKCRSWAAKTFNDAPDAALCVGAGDRLLYAAQLLDQLAIAAEKEVTPEAMTPAWVAAYPKSAAYIINRLATRVDELEACAVRGEKDAQAKQEPVAWRSTTRDGDQVYWEKKPEYEPSVPLYLAPQPSEPSPVDVPLPEPTLFFIENFGLGDDTRHTGYTAEQMHQYAEAYAQAKVAAERERCIKLANDQWVANPNISGGDAIRASQKGTT